MDVDATFKGLLEEYLAGVNDCKIHTLEDLIKFNEEHADQELPPSKLITLRIVMHANTY